MCKASDNVGVAKSNLLGSFSSANLNGNSFEIFRKVIVNKIYTFWEARATYPAKMPQSNFVKTSPVKRCPLIVVGLNDHTREKL